MRGDTQTPSAVLTSATQVGACFDGDRAVEARAREFAAAGKAAAKAAATATKEAAAKADAAAKAKAKPKLEAKGWAKA